MSWVQHQLVSIVGAKMTGDFRSAIDNPHQYVGSNQRQLAAHSFWRDRVIVLVEADVDGFGCPYGHHPFCAEGMQRRRQQARTLLRENLRDGAAVISRPGSLMRNLGAPAQRLPVTFGQRSEATARPEGIADV